MSAIQANFKAYNIYTNINDIHINDAVKITSNPQFESFWVEIKSINKRTNLIRGTVQNILQRPHNYNHEDLIEFKLKNIKMHKLEKDRFALNNLTQDEIMRILLASMSNMNIEEFESSLNTRNIVRD